MLRVVVERDAGNVVEGRLLGNVARVGNYSLGMGGELAEVEIAHAFHNMNVWLVGNKRCYGLS